MRAIGCSNFVTHRLATANHIAQIHGLPRYEVLQARHTFLQPRADADTGRQVVLTQDMAEYCVTSDMSIMAYSATLGGSYAGDPARAVPLAYRSLANEARLKQLQTIADEVRAAPLQVMLAWLWTRPKMLPLIAVSSPEQLATNLAASEIKLSADQLSRLNIAGE